MTVYEQIHHSKTHREGFDQACPQCLRDQGISGIISHLEQCAKQNEADSRSVGDSAISVALEQRRMAAILRLYQRATK